MTQFITLVLGLAVAGFVMALLLGLRSRWQAESAEEDRLYFSSMATTLEEVELEQPFRERVLRPVVASVLSVLSRLAPRHNIEQTQHMLEVAGRPYNWSVADFMGLRVLTAFLFAFLVFVLLLFGDVQTMVRLVLTLLIGALGFFYALALAEIPWQQSPARARPGPTRRARHAQHLRRCRPRL
jgi:tight adherence protein C